MISHWISIYGIKKLLNHWYLVNTESLSLGTVASIAVTILVFLLITHDSKNSNVMSYIPDIYLQITFLPLIIILSQLNRRINLINIGLNG
jgi:hypothetical protein